MRVQTCLFALFSTLACACAPFKIDPPTGFVEVSGGSWETRMKAQDNVGLRVHRFDNVRGGTLGYWAADLVNKLGKRGYTLVNQQPAASKNGKQGTRFDFEYTAPATEEAKFYSVVLFVTDRYKVTLEVAGDKQYAAAYQPRMGEFTRELKVRGCKAGSKICRGPQPPKLQSPPPDPIPGAEPPATVTDPAPATGP
jgi:hypothetical protein